MEVTLPIKELNDVFQILNTVVPSRAIRPVLSYIYISAEKKTLTLTATDLEVGVEITIDNANKCFQIHLKDRKLNVLSHVHIFCVLTSLHVYFLRALTALLLILTFMPSFFKC